MSGQALLRRRAALAQQLATAGIGEYRCPECDGVFRRPNDFTNHHKNRHGANVPRIERVVRDDIITAIEGVQNALQSAIANNALRHLESESTRTPSPALTEQAATASADAYSFGGYSGGEGSPGSGDAPDCSDEMDAHECDMQEREMQEREREARVLPALKDTLAHIWHLPRTPPSISMETLLQVQYNDPARSASAAKVREERAKNPSYPFASKDAFAAMELLHEFNVSAEKEKKFETFINKLYKTRTLNIAQTRRDLAQAFAPGPNVSVYS